ncbi:MAG: DNA (cytosine-5-)-methyltransferase [Gammaproteobacteria bacterium]|nr:MAG: DNA (cytosine-5-)-methyltransferase [Gammaproteobacteria bacterium]
METLAQTEAIDTADFSGGGDEAYTFAEFFAGIGLMRLGLEQAGWEIRFANDLDAKKLEMYKARFPDADEHYLLKDVHKVGTADLPTVDLATASFPCTDLSLAGARKGLAGKESSAFWGFLNAIKSMGDRRPPLILLENVTGFLTSHGGKDFLEAMLALNDLGYTVDPFIIDAARFVPQSRQRLFVVGTSRHDRIREPAAQSRFFECEARPGALADFIFRHGEIDWDLRNLPSLPQRDMQLEDVIEDLPENDKMWWSAERVDYLLNQMSDRHRKLVDSMVTRGGQHFATVFRRVRKGRSMAEVRADGIAGCLRTPKGGSGRQILILVEDARIRVRLLSPNECARLMGADGYPITVSLNQALFGFGDAVCVDAVEWIARNYLNPAMAELDHLAARRKYGGR